MKAFTKRMIWFFGNNMLVLLNEVACRIQGVDTAGYIPWLDIGFPANIWLASLFIPMFFFKSDEDIEVKVKKK